MYLAGSIHLLSNEYYPLAPAFDEAFQNSDLLVEELDMAELLAPDAQMQMLTRGMMPSGKTLDSEVPYSQEFALELLPNTLNALRFLLEESMDIENFQNVSTIRTWSERDARVPDLVM